MSSISARRLKELVREDRAISKEAESATKRLMEHRWNAVQEVGTNVAYAEALGVSEFTVRRYVRAWELWQEESNTRVRRTPDDVLSLATMSEQRRAAVEAVADAKGIGVRAVTQRHMADVRQVRRAMREEADSEESIDKGRRVARSIETVRKAAATQRQEHRRSTPAAYLDLDNHLTKANRSLTEALGIARDEHLADEYVAMIGQALDRTRGILDLIHMALTGTSVDWDRELAKLQAGE